VLRWMRRMRRAVDRSASETCHAAGFDLAQSLQLLGIGTFGAVEDAFGHPREEEHRCGD